VKHKTVSTLGAVDSSTLTDQLVTLKISLRYNRRTSVRTGTQCVLAVTAGVVLQRTDNDTARSSARRAVSTHV